MENKNILAKLYAIMSEVGYIQKDKKNTFHGYSYLSEKAIKETLHPLLVKHRVLFLPTTADFENKEVETATKSGTRRSILTTGNLGFRFVDVDSGEFYEGSMAAAGMDEGDKGTYKAITGALKYILTTSFLIPTGDDPEDDRNDSPATAQKATSKADSMHDGAFAILKDKIAAENDFGKLEQFKASLMEKSHLVTPAQFKDLLDRIDKKIKKANLKETKQESRNTAELDIVEDTTIQINESE
jgi:ERF superfamily protein